MLKRALRRASRSSSFSENESKPKRPRPATMGNPVMMMALGKVARGESAGLVSEACRASVLECGAANVSQSLLA